MNKRKQFTRKSFENLISGDWESMKGDRYRENGKFRTYIKDQWKFVSDGNSAIKARTWKELSDVLELA